VTKQLEAPETLIYTGKVQELLQLELDSGQRNLVIGGAVTYSKAEPLLTRHFTGWDEMLNRLGAVQVRNAGTIGGNIANGSPIGDMPPGLIALDARLVLASKSGEREIALEDFFIRYGEQDLRPGECVARIVLPLPSAGLQFRTYKLSKRIEQDISAVSAAFSIALNAGRISEARVCYGGLAETPRRAAGCEKELQGSAWDSATLDRAMQALGDDFQPITDMRASSQYRLDAARNLLRRFFFETTGADYPVRLSSRYPDLGEPA